MQFRKKNDTDEDFFLLILSLIKNLWRLLFKLSR